MLKPHRAAVVATIATTIRPRQIHTMTRWAWAPCLGRRSIGESARAHAPAMRTAVMTSAGLCHPSIMTETPMSALHAHPIQAEGLRNNLGATTTRAREMVTATVVCPDGSELPAPVVTPRLGRVRMYSLRICVVMLAPMTAPRARPASVGRRRAAATRATTVPAMYSN